MDTNTKVQFIQQCYKLATMAHMTSKAFQIIYQNNLYGLVSDSNQTEASSDYELKVIESLSEICMSISDMCSCMTRSNPVGFDKIFAQVNHEATILVTMFNQINDAAQRKKSNNSEEDSSDMGDGGELA